MLITIISQILFLLAFCFLVVAVLLLFRLLLALYLHLITWVALNLFLFLFLGDQSSSELCRHINFFVQENVWLKIVNMLAVEDLLHHLESDLLRSGVIKLKPVVLLFHCANCIANVVPRVQCVS
jgi:hypothetical protein